MSKRIVRLTESELIRLVKRVVNEQFENEQGEENINPEEVGEGWLGNIGKGIRKFATGHESSEERESKKQKLEDELDEITDMVNENPNAFFMGHKWDRAVAKYKEKMEDNNYRGFFTIDNMELDNPKLEKHVEEVINDPSSEMVVRYNDVHSKMQHMGSGAGSSVRSGMSRTISNESYYRRKNRLR